jgi:hypothetical protein
VVGGSCNEINGVRDPWEPRTGVRGRTVLKWGPSVQRRSECPFLDGPTGVVAFFQEAVARVSSVLNMVIGACLGAFRQ